MAVFTPTLVEGIDNTGGRSIIDRFSPLQEHKIYKRNSSTILSAPQVPISQLSSPDSEIAPESIKIPPVPL